MTPEIQLKYKAWLEKEAELIGSDGCTLVEEIYHHCCLEHDLAYWHKKNPRVAFLLGGWEDCAPITRSLADAQFKQCIQLASPFKQWSPMAWWRYLAVRAAGWVIWRKRGNPDTTKS